MTSATAAGRAPTQLVSATADPLVGEELSAEKDGTLGVQRIRRRRGRRRVVDVPEGGGVTNRPNGDVE